jgi:hypothetical protein
MKRNVVRKQWPFRGAPSRAVNGRTDKTLTGVEADDRGGGGEAEEGNKIPIKIRMSEPIRGGSKENRVKTVALEWSFSSYGNFRHIFLIEMAPGAFENGAKHMKLNCRVSNNILSHERNIQYQYVAIHQHGRQANFEVPLVYSS